MKIAGTTKITKDLLDAEMLSGETIISRILIRIANLNYSWENLSFLIREFIRIEQTDDGYICKYTHRKFYTSIDYDGTFRPRYLYEICLLTNTPASVFLNGTKEDIDALPTELPFDPEKDHFHAFDYKKAFCDGIRKRIRSHRINCGLSEDDFGKVVGVTGYTIREFERCAVAHSRFLSMENVNKLCAMFDVDIDTLMFGEDLEKPLRDWVQYWDEYWRKEKERYVQKKPAPQAEKPHTVNQIMACRDNVIENIDKANVETLFKVQAFLRQELANQTA